MRHAAQPDLFASLPRTEAAPAAARPEAELELIRRDLYPLLEQAERAERLPWSYTRATVIEIQVEGWANWLPEAEAAAVRARFAAALDRLYALEPGADPA